MVAKIGVDTAESELWKEWLRDAEVSQVPSDRRALFDRARSLQQEGGMAGAEYLCGAEGLHPMYWGVSKAQLEDFREEVLEAMRKGEIQGQSDRSKELRC